MPSGSHLVAKLSVTSHSFLDCNALSVNGRWAVNLGKVPGLLQVLKKPLFSETVSIFVLFSMLRLYTPIKSLLHRGRDVG